MLQIGICGTECTGKTSLAKEITDFLEIPLIKEQARVVAAGLNIRNMQQDLPDEVWEQFQWDCLHYQIKAETDLCKAGKGFVSDRTVLDNLAYWLVDRMKTANYKDTCQYFKEVKDHLFGFLCTPYDVIIFCNCDKRAKIEDDHFRHNDYWHRLVVEEVLEILIAWAKEYSDIKVITIDGHIDEKVGAALYGIQHFLLLSSMAGRRDIEENIILFKDKLEKWEEKRKNIT